MKVQNDRRGYSISINKRYLRSWKAIKLPPCTVSDKAGVQRWIEASPGLKQAMDRHITKDGRVEREFQQILVRDNNFRPKAKVGKGRRESVAKSTDYFICDIEYRTEQKKKFDLVAVHWPSVDRKEARNRRLVLVEMKYGDRVLKRPPGLKDHVDDVNEFLGDHDNVERLKDEMRRIFNQKRSLGLIHCEKDLAGFSNEPPMLLLVLANHNPVNEELLKALRSLDESRHAELCIGTASFFGYGLYEQGVHTIQSAFRCVGQLIYKDLS